MRRPRIVRRRMKGLATRRKTMGKTNEHEKNGPDTNEEAKDRRQGQHPRGGQALHEKEADNLEDKEDRPHHEQEDDGPENE
jgi:hypothetical protein